MSKLPSGRLATVFTYVEQGQLPTCSLVCKEWAKAASPLLWRKPRFGGRFLTRAQAFETFLRCLTICRPEILDLIRVINLNKFEESLYSELPEDWLNTVTSHCPKLEELHVAESSIFSSTSLKRVKNRHPLLRVINLTNCKNIGSNGFMLLGRMFPNLLQLLVSGCAGLNEKTLSQLVYLCDDLQRLELAHCPGLTDNCLHAVAKFGKGNIQELDLTGNVYLTDKTLQSISMYCCRLKSLTFRECQLITPKGLEYLTQGLNSHLEALDVSFCRACPLDDSILNLLSAKLSNLSNFTLSFPQINLAKRGINSIITCLQGFARLQHLTIHFIPENVSLEFLKGVIENCKQLKVITLYRQAYTCDYIFGFYSKSNHSEMIHEENIRALLQDHPRLQIHLKREEMY
ncbi:RNI-like protein [Basidiobolus meristosporus CBS 931.73]|uniref:RNI-like protein n=1 Tax=Basidiobolus meristosporus CBS 931.73 TaxID=1314790 RepID=A0A1Y1Z370_9FUNG|nr:RNI-like protein [Basidiobolus meristosporus CBS 931.73]|eukprot:ORY04730.1 RNI-like protein [Basidiobolus meristosporus CBS 931.73]